MRKNLKFYKISLRPTHYALRPTHYAYIGIFTMINLQYFKRSIIELIKNSNDIVITGHENPDGDSIGSEIALYLLLSQMGKNVRIINHDPCPETYYYLTGAEKIETSYSNDSSDNKKIFQLAFMLDHNERKRTGQNLVKIYDNSRTLIRIDHHKENEKIEQSISYIDESYAATCEILYFIFYKEIENLPTKIRLHIANALYTGIIYDTNNFVNRNTNCRTFSVCAKLTEWGVEPSYVYEKIFNMRSVSEVKLLGYSLANIEPYMDGKLILMITHKDIANELNVDIDKTNKFLAELQMIKDWEIIVYIRELDKDYFRVSLRAKHIDIRQVAEYYGGGGHKLAAGFKVRQNLFNLKEELIKTLCNLINYKSSRKQENKSSRKQEKNADTVK